MSGDLRDLAGDKQFSACPDSQAGGHQRLKTNRTANAPTLFGCPDQTQQVGDCLRAECGRPTGANVRIGEEDRGRTLVEVRANPRPWLSGPTRTWRTRDWCGG